MAEALKRAFEHQRDEQQKQTPATIAKERKRERKNPVMPAPGLAFTPQIVLSAFCNWPKTPLAPKSARKIPVIVASKPLFGCDAFCATLLTTSRALLSRK